MGKSLFDYVPRQQEETQAEQAGTQTQDSVRAPGLFDYVKDGQVVLEAPKPFEFAAPDPMRQLRKDEEAAFKAYDDARDATGINGLFNRTYDWWRNQIEWANDPNNNVGWAVDSGTEANMDIKYPETGDGRTEKERLDELPGLYKGWQDAKDARQDAEYSQKYFNDLYTVGNGNPDALLQATQAGLNNAKRKGDEEEIARWQEQLDYYTGFSEQLQTQQRYNTTIQNWQTEYGTGVDSYEQAEENYKQAEENYRRATGGAVNDVTDEDIDNDVEYKQRVLQINWDREHDPSIDNAEYERLIDVARDEAAQRLSRGDMSPEDAAKALQEAQWILGYAATQHYAGIQAQPGYDRVAEEGRQLFEDYKAGGFADQQDEDEYNRKMEEAERYVAEELGLEPGTEEYNVEMEWWEQQARLGYTTAANNSSRWDPRYHTEFKEPDDRWTDEEKQLFYYLYRADSLHQDEDGYRNKAEEYAIGINGKYNAQEAEQKRLEREEYATRSFGTGALASIGGAVVPLATGLYDYAKMAAESEYRGGIYESKYEGATLWAEQSTAAVANRLNELSGTIDDDAFLFGGKGLGDVYQLFESMAQSGAAIAMTGGSSALINAMFFGSAAASATRAALDRGLDGNHAILTGLASGAAEAIGETLSIENLLSNKGLADFLTKGAVRELFKQGGVEMSEEMFTTFMNGVTDKLINGDKSEFNSKVIAKTWSGMSYEDAVREVRKEQLEGALYDGLGGFLSGAGMGGVHFGAYAVPASLRQYQGDAQQLFDTATLAGRNSASYQAAVDYARRFDNKGSITQYQGEKLEAQLAEDMAGDEQERFTELLNEFDTDLNGTEEFTTLEPEESVAGKENTETFEISREAEEPFKRLETEEPVTVEASTEPSIEISKESKEETPAGTRVMAEEKAEEPAAESSEESTEADTEAAAQERSAEAPEEETKEEAPAEEQTKTQEMLGRVSDLLDALADPKAEMPNGMTREDVQKRVDQLVDKMFPGESNRPGLKFEGSSSIEQLRSVVKALQNMETRDQKQITKAKEMRKALEDIRKNVGVDYDDATQITTEDGETATIKGAKYSAETGVTTILAVDSNGKETLINSKELTGPAAELFESMEDMLGKEHAAVAFGEMQKGQRATEYAVDFRTVRNLGQASSKEYAQIADKVNEIKGSLTEEQAKLAFQLGKGMARRRVTQGARSKRGTGHVTMNGGILNGVSLGAVKDQEALRNSEDFKLIQSYAKALGIDVKFYESEAGADKRYQGANGAYEDGTIWLDVHAGMDYENVGERMFFTTFAHELTHFIKQNATEKYQALEDRVTEYLQKSKDVSFGELVRGKLARSSTRLTYDAAVEEVIADACETMLRDSEAINELAKKDAGLFATMREFFKNWVDRILARHEEAKAIQPYIKELQKIWDDALIEAVESRSNVEALSDPSDAVVEITGDDGEDYGIYDSSTGEGIYSLRSFEEGGRDALASYLNSRVESEALTKDEAKQILDQMDELYRICDEYDGKYAPFSAWSNAEVVRDENGKPVFSVVKANGEYALNLDFSLVCKKRRTLDAVFNEMIRQGIMDDFDMVQESIAKINDIIRENDFETACGLCFVDSKRYRQGMVATAFTMMWNTQVRSLARKGQKIDYHNFGGDNTLVDSGAGIDTLADDQLDWSTVDKILKTEKNSTVKWKIANYLKTSPKARRLVSRGDFMSTAGFDELKRRDPDLLKIYNSKKGAGGPKAAQSDVQYMNDILKDKAFNPEAAYAVGGVRIQSFSDYMGRMVFDYIQMVGDLAAKQLPAHSYTKEFYFAQQFGLTGIKINMSLVPEIIKDGVAPGLDANGNYAWKDGQSFGSTVYDNNGKRLTAAEGFELAKRIQNADGYSKNCGTIAVGVSDQHILKMLDDPDIRMIIPYHKSSLNHILAVMMNINKYEDYTLQQSTRQRKNGKWVKLSPSQEFNFNEALQRLGDAKAAAAEYVKWCKDNGYLPKFDGTKGGHNFSEHENYYKLLEDFSCYDKDGVTNAPMDAVTMTFPTEANEFGSMKDLIAAGLEEDAILQAKQDKAVPGMVEQIKQILPEFEADVRSKGKKIAAPKSDVKMSDRETPFPKNASDAVRYRYLRGMMITPVVYKGNLDTALMNIQGNSFDEKVENLKSLKMSDIRRAFKELSTKLGIPDRNYHADEIDLDFTYSNRAIGESVQYQETSRIAGLVKALTLFDSLAKNAIPLNIRDDIYVDKLYPSGQTSTEAWYSCISAYLEEGRLIPVKIDIDERKGEQNRAHLMVTFTEIQTGENIDGRENDGVMPNLPATSADRRYAPRNNVPPLLTYNISDILRNVNSNDFQLLLDIPDGFLNASQIQGKSVALDRFEKHLAEKIASRKKSGKLDEFYVKQAYDAARIAGDRKTAELFRETFAQTDDNAKMSERDDSRTDRDLLLNTDGATLTAAEREALEKYRAKAEQLREQENKITAALAVFDRMVRDGESDDAVKRQRAKVSNLTAKMQQILRELSDAETGDKTMLEIIRKEREIQRRRTSMRTREVFTRRDLRAKITRLYNDINRRITSPTKDKNIPVDVMMQAIDVMQAINMDSTKPDSKAGEKLRNKLLELQAKYAALQNDPDFRKAAAYDYVVAELMQNMIEKVGDTPINRMSAEQMQAVYDALRALDKTARTALKIKMLGEERDAYQIAMQMTKETRSVAKPSKNLLAQYLNAQLTPERMFNRLGGYQKNSAWLQVYRMLNDGQLTATRLQIEGSAIFDELMKGKDYDKFVDPKSTVDIGLKDEDGHAIPITHGMMVSLYMHLQNEQNRRHVAYGGLTVPNLRDYYNGKRNRGIDNSIHAMGVSQEIGKLRDQLKVETDEGVREDLQNQILEAENKAMTYVGQLQEAIDKQLTDYDRQWIAAAKDLFDRFSKEHLNEATMETYGIKRANVDNYFPIWVDGDFLQTPFESIAKDMSLENVGFLKERVDSAKPMRLADVSDVSASQLRRVAQYCGLMPVTRNFQKIWGKVQTGYRNSLQSQVRDKFGQAGIQYVENLMADLNGARRQKDGPMGEFFSTVRGHMAQASLTLSARTALGQTASFPSAASVVGWDALRKAFIKGGKNGHMLSRADQELIAKYSPLLAYRMKGYSTTELGDLAGSNSKTARLWKKMRWATGWIQAMDGATVGRLWYAAEFYVQDHNKDLTKGTDAYYQEVARIFNDIVEKTQPDYTVMQRPDILRNPNALVRQMTMFLTQRLQNFNIMYDSIATYNQRKKDLANKVDGVTAQDVREAGRDVSRAVTSQLAAAATITAFKALADFILNSVKAYRDDDEELTEESISKELLDMFLDSLAGNVLFGGEIYDLIESRVFGKTYYGIEVSGVSTVTDIIESANKALDAAMSDGATWQTFWQKGGHQLTKNIATLLGIPLNNAEKIVRGMYNHAVDAINGEPLSYEAGVERTTAQQAHRIYRAYTESNFGTAKKIREQVGDDEKLNKALVTYIKQLYADGTINRIQAQNQLVKFAGKTQEAAEKTIRDFTAKQETGMNYDEIDDAFSRGDITAAEARDTLIKYGASRDKATMKVDYWAYRDEYPATKFTQDSFETYYTKYKPLGMTPRMYETFKDDWNAVTGTDKNGDGKADSGSKKEDRILIIDALPLSAAQKDELFKMNWSSGLDKTPWHNGGITGGGTGRK